MSTARFQTGMEGALQLAGTWTDISDYLYNRTQPAVTITRGRPDETATISPSQMTGQLNNRDGRFTSRNPTGPYYPALTRNTPVRLSVPDSGTYLRIEDDNTSTCSCPDSSALRPATGITVELDVNLSNYQPCLLMSKWGATALAWAFYLNGDGSLGFAWYDGSAGHFGNGSTQPIPNLGRITLIVAFDASAGTIEFFTAATIGGSQTQLGTAITVASTSISAATGQAVAVGGGDFAVTTGSGGLQGQVFEARIYNASSVLVAGPVFTSQTAGATSFTDGQSNTWTVNGTAELSDRSYRYHGEMSSLPVAWDTSGRDIWVPFQASGILRRLSQGNSPVLSAMRRAVTDLISSSAPPRAYWPAEDLQGSAQLASGLPGGLPMRILGTPSLAENSDFPCSNSLPEFASAIFTGLVPAYTSNGSVIFRFLLSIPSGGDTDFSIIAALPTTGTLGWLVSYQTSGIFLGNGAGTVVTSPIDVTGVPVMVSAEITPGSGTTVHVALSVMTLSGEVTTVTTTTTGTIGNLTSVVLNTPGIFGGQLASAAFGHPYVQDTWTDITTMTSQLAAWAGETAGNRFARLCAENSISPRVYGFPDQSVVMGAQSIDTLANVLQDCEKADNGMMYEPRQSFGLGYRTLASMCNQAPALTLNYAAAEVGDQESSPVSLTSIDDDQYTRNDVTVTRTAGTEQGSSYEYALGDGSPMSVSPPPTGVGAYTNAVSVNVNTDSQLPDAASWLVHVGTVAEERYPTITTGLHRPEVIAAGIGYDIQDVSIGDYVQVENPPAWLPPGTISQVIAGVTEQLSSYLYQIAWNAIPESPYEVMVVSDTVYGRGNTDGSTLQTPVSATATSMQVATTDSLSPLWTTSSGDFPFNVLMAGEVIEVTNITGGSSPQTFDITRSINGVVKAQTAGTAVSLYPAPVAALT